MQKYYKDGGTNVKAELVIQIWLFFSLCNLNGHIKVSNYRYSSQIYSISDYVRTTGGTANNGACLSLIDDLHPFYFQLAYVQIGVQTTIICHVVICKRFIEMSFFLMRMGENKRIRPNREIFFDPEKVFFDPELFFDPQMERIF